MEILSDFVLGDTTARYLHDPGTGRVGLLLFPSAQAEKLIRRRVNLNGDPFAEPSPESWNPPAMAVDSLAQIKILGDPYPGSFASGHTMRQSVSVARFRYQDQEKFAEKDRTRIVTLLKSADGLALEHILDWRAGENALGVNTRFFNGSKAPVTLEMLSSFSLSGLSPFDFSESINRLRAHRFRSVWAAEGRLESQGIEELHLERAWSDAPMFSERFGQVGSMPVRKWFPFLAIEDAVAGVTWGAQLAWAGSWQMEIFRQHDDVCISGGLADREFGHWMKSVAPGDWLDAPPATLACVTGGLDEVCDALTQAQHHAADTHPAVEADLPIVFNEWCTTWGDPTHEKTLAIADRLQGSDTKYLVIDAGWFKEEGTTWFTGHGDWNPSAKLFPEGLKATADAIRARGLLPGLWFELETCGESSVAFSLADHLLQRDGIPVTSNNRRFWNLNDPWVVDYLTRKVIDTLRDAGFAYLKVDYNETIGLGTDHPDSLGEGLRQQTLGTHRFFEKIRRELPGLVIENCASGGHRLEPSMIARTAMSSFSDAHESLSIPIIAASLQRLLLPRQAQIWAVIHGNHSDQKLAYRLASTFLGRMCISGGITGLTDAQWQFVKGAQALYRQAVPVLKHGTSRRFSQMGPSWRNPEGWQAVRRISDDGTTALVVLHTFAHAPASVSIPLPEGSWKITGQFPRAEISLADRLLRFSALQDLQGTVALLERR